MATKLEQARSAATVILVSACGIVRQYSQDKGWIQSPNCLTIPALEFGGFLRDVIDAERVVHAVADQLIDAKRDDRIVRFGDNCERTAHQVAVRFARQVGAAIWLNMWTDDNGLPMGTAFEPWPIDGLMSEQNAIEFQERWQDIRTALAGVNLGSVEEMLPLIQLETRRAIQTPGPVVSSGLPDNSLDARHSADFRSVWWFGSTYQFTGNQAAVVKSLWAAWMNKTPVLSSATLSEAADSESRISVIFRGHEAFGTMIVAVGKDAYRLQEPQSQDTLQIRP